MRVFLDQGLPRRAAELLRASGIDCTHAAEAELASASDADIVTWCRERGFVAVTLDADLHAIVALSGQSAPSVVRLRIQGLTASTLAPLLLETLRSREAELTTGALVTVLPTRLRLRRLPIARPAR